MQCLGKSCWELCGNVFGQLCRADAIVNAAGDGVGHVQKRLQDMLQEML